MLGSGHLPDDFAPQNLVTAFYRHVLQPCESMFNTTHDDHARCSVSVCEAVLYGCLPGQTCRLQDKPWIIIAYRLLHCGVQGVHRCGPLRYFSLLLLYFSQAQSDEAYVIIVRSLLRGLDCHPWRCHPAYQTPMERSDVAPTVSLLLFLESQLSVGSPPTALNTDVLCVAGWFLRESRLQADMSEAQRRDAAPAAMLRSSICRPETLKVCFAHN